MNDKKLYKVTITDESGKVMHEVESDCIIAAISDPSRATEKATAVHGIYMTECNGHTIVSAFKSLDAIKRNATEQNPELGAALAIQTLAGLAKKFGLNLDEEDEVEETSHNSAGGGVCLISLQNFSKSEAWL